MVQTTLALLLFLAPLALSPGPGNLFFAAAGARYGLRGTWPALAGYHAVTWAVTVTVGLGLMVALHDHPRLMRALTLAGAAYVLWLAWRILRAGTLAEEGEARRATPASGAILLLLNPKAYVIITLMFTQFLTRFPLPPIPAVLLIATVFTANNLLVFVLWTLAGDRLAARFRSRTSARRLNVALAAMLAGVAIWMLAR